MPTVCTEVYVPSPSLNAGVAAVGVRGRVSTGTNVVGMVTVFPANMTLWLSVSKAVVVLRL
jgi:hypothetical protein